MEKNKYVLVLDTNLLYKDYNKNLDFKKFSFPSFFENVQHKIEELDIVDYVTIALPEMCWEELKIQFIDEHRSKLDQAKLFLERYKGLPEISFDINEKIDIKASSSELVNKYKEAILNSQSGAKTIELPLPDGKCFKNVITRAINKEFPFHITNSHSDYGFKDVVIWESVLKYKAEHKDYKILLYSEDKGFNDKLCKEFNDLFKEDIKIIKDKSMLYSLLDEIAKENVDDVKLYNPEPDGDETEKIINWLYTESFKEELIRVIDKTILGNNAIIQDVSLFDYRFLSSNNDYENFQLHMEILVGLLVDRLGKIEEMIKMFNICIDFPYEENLPILILDCTTCAEDETIDWIKNMEIENE